MFYQTHIDLIKKKKKKYNIEKFYSFSISNFSRTSDSSFYLCAKFNFVNKSAM